MPQFKPVATEADTEQKVLCRLLFAESEELKENGSLKNNFLREFCPGDITVQGLRSELNEEQRQTLTEQQQALYAKLYLDSVTGGDKLFEDWIDKNGHANGLIGKVIQDVQIKLMSSFENSWINSIQLPLTKLKGQPRFQIYREDNGKNVIYTQATIPFAFVVNQKLGDSKEVEDIAEPDYKKSFSLNILIKATREDGYIETKIVYADLECYDNFLLPYFETLAGSKINREIKLIAGIKKLKKLDENIPAVQLKPLSNEALLLAIENIENQLKKLAINSNLERTARFNAIQNPLDHIVEILKGTNRSTEQSADIDIMENDVISSNNQSPNSPRLSSPDSSDDENHLASPDSATASTDELSGFSNLTNAASVETKQSLSSTNVNEIEASKNLDVLRQLAEIQKDMAVLVNENSSTPNSAEFSAANEERMPAEQALPDSVFKSPSRAKTNLTDKQNLLEEQALSNIDGMVKRLHLQATFKRAPISNTLSVSTNNEPTTVEHYKVLKCSEGEKLSTTMVEENFKTGLQKFSLFRSKRAKTLYTNGSHLIETELARQTLEAVILKFSQAIEPKDIKWHGGKIMYYHNLQKRLPRTAATIVKIYNQAQACDNGMDWVKALAKTEALLLDNYKDPKARTHWPHLRSENVQKIYNAALDIIQDNYRASKLEYYKTTLNERLENEHLFDFAVSRTKWIEVKNLVDIDLATIKTYFGKSEVPFKFHSIAEKLDALDYLSYQLFQRSKKIWFGQRNGSDLYKAIMFKIAEFQGYDVEKFKGDKEKEKNLIYKIENFMHYNEHSFKVRAEKFSVEYLEQAANSVQLKQ